MSEQKKRILRSPRVSGSRSVLESRYTVCYLLCVDSDSSSSLLLRSRSLRSLACSVSTPLRSSPSASMPLLCLKLDGLPLSPPLLRFLFVLLFSQPLRNRLLACFVSTPLLFFLLPALSQLLCLVLIVFCLFPPLSLLFLASTDLSVERLGAAIYNVRQAQSMQSLDEKCCSVDIYTLQVAAVLGGLPAFAKPRLLSLFCFGESFFFF
jgi:hypothetical protein